MMISKMMGLRQFRKVLQHTQCSNFRLTHHRNMFYHPSKFTEAENKLKLIDNIPKDWHLIYRGPMDKPLNFAATYLTTSTALMTAGAIYYAAAVFDVNDMDKPILINDVILANNGYECMVYFLSFVIFHIAVKVVLSKYIIRMYQNGEIYIAVFRGHIHNTIKKHEFNRNNVQKLKTQYVITWPDARYSLGNKHAIILDHYFKTPEHFNYLVNKSLKSDPNRDY